jgi:hypothetical protein
MKSKFLAVPAVVLGVAAGLSGQAAPAVGEAAPAETTVTIKAEGTDLSGKVISPRPLRCAQDRKVILMKQIGTRGGGDDINFASDTAGLQGDVYTWSTGTTGTPGRFYAKVKPIQGCKGDTSPTVRAQRT